jgi:hypothetical protein
MGYKNKYVNKWETEVENNSLIGNMKAPNLAMYTKIAFKDNTVRATSCTVCMTPGETFRTPDPFASFLIL